MGTENMKLPEVEKAMFATSRFLHKEWVMDPPPFILERLPDILNVDIYKVKLKYMAQMAMAEANMLNEVVEIISKHK